MTPGAALRPFGGLELIARDPDFLPFAEIVGLKLLPMRR